MPRRTRHVASGLPALSSVKGRPKTVHVLVVEDHSINRKVALHQLLKLGYQADAVAGGSEALEAIVRTSYDAVLMDCQMPEMDGYETSRRIRNRERGRQHVIIVAMTAHALEGDREKCLAAGMDDYLSKPVKTDELDAMLKRWFPHGRRTRVASASSSEPDGKGPVLDGRTIEELRAGDPAMFGELVELFFKDVGAKLAQMKQAWEGNDLEALARVAHGLKGVSGAMGALRMQALCARINEAAIRGLARACATPFAELGNEYQRIRALLQQKAAAR